MIEVRSLSKFYGSHQVLNDLNLAVKKGAVTGIVGPNACGKTTLVKCLLGLVVPSVGEIWIDQKKSDRNGDFRKKIGYMPQIPVFPRNLTTHELLNMLERLRGEPASSRQELIEYFHLHKFLNQPLEQLSGGTQQKISAVIAFMFNAPLIILDEPTVGLDPVTSVHFKDLVLKRVQQNTTVVLVSHIMTEVEQMASEMIFLNEGEVVFSGTTSALLMQTSSRQLERAVIQLFQERTK